MFDKMEPARLPVCRCPAIRQEVPVNGELINAHPRILTNAPAMKILNSKF
jgi:hypothetical protein